MSATAKEEAVCTDTDHVLYRLYHDNNDSALPDPAGNDTRLWLVTASKMLRAEWPRGGTAEAYADKIVQPRSMGGGQYTLPCSYVLVNGRTCVGHGRLTECFEGSGGSAAAATYIVIEAGHRGQGHGAVLMRLLEREVTRLGYHYLFLWTSTAVGFYRRLGYMMCERVTLQRPCLGMLGRSQLDGLESMLMARLGRTGGKPPSAPMAPQQGAAVAAVEDAIPAVPPTNESSGSFTEHAAGAGDVWLKKRLAEATPSVAVDASKIVTDMVAEAHVAYQRACCGAVDAAPSTTAIEDGPWAFQVLSVPWQRQIGPSCGLAALRMVRDFFLEQAANDNGAETTSAAAQMPSLLKAAQERGFTSDGEVFVASDLAALATDVCGLRCDVRACTALTPLDIVKALTAGHCIIVPYDSHPGTRLPSLSGGRSAHYGVIVGAMILDAGVTDAPAPAPMRKDAAKDVGNDALVVALQHSMSERLCVAMWSEFVASNVQLLAADGSRFSPSRIDLADRVLVCHGLAD
eukprot:m.205599 g.205599  ORF g.205599 m.205599 type:complete len:517 (-) comp23016_c0_seq1:82-1632(-)